MNSLQIVSSRFKETYVLLMDYPSIRGEDFTSYSKNATWNLLHSYIDVHCQRLIYEYPGYVVQSITRNQSQCANRVFAEKIRYNRLFWKVVYKGWESEINHIQIFQNAKTLAMSVVNGYS